MRWCLAKGQRELANEEAALLTEVDTVTSGGYDEGLKVGVGDRWEQGPGGVELSGVGA